MYEHNALGFWSGLALCLTKVRSSRARCPATALIVGWGRSFLSVAWLIGVQLVFIYCSGVSKLFGAQGSPSSDSFLNLLSPRF